MAEDVPEILTQDFITEMWRAHFKDPTLTTTDFKIGLVGAKGDNYSSIMTRVECKIHTNGKTLEKPMVIKTMPVGAGVRQFVTENKAFEKETEMLSKICPAFEEILSKAGVDTKMTAPVYYHADNEIIAMEDLSKSGFSVGNRYQGLPLENCLSVVRTLADFHAASMVYLTQNKLGEQFKTGTFPRSQITSTGRGMMDSFQTIIDQIDTWSSVKWSDKLKVVQKKLPGAFYDKTEKIDPKRPLVLNHGDLWINNIMFRPNTELRFVDLQLSWMQSPVFDVQYFLFTSPSLDVRMHHIKDILKTYHERFLKVTALLKLEIDYSYEDFLQDCKDNLIFAFVMFFYIFPITSAPKENAVDTSKDDSDIMKNNPIFSHAFFRKTFLEILPYFEECGLFNE